MLLSGRTPLGWKQLIHSKGRFAIAVCGVAFAVLLIFMQLGFMNVLFDSTVMMHRQLNADIVLLSSTARDFANPGTLPRQRVTQALGVAGVVDAEPLYVVGRDWIKQTAREPGERGQMLILGVRPDFRAFRDPEVTAQQARLVETGGRFSIVARVATTPHFSRRSTPASDRKRNSAAGPSPWWAPSESVPRSAAKACSLSPTRPSLSSR